ncbi:MAG: phosphotransferase, partial [Bacteroidota bacterium]
MPNQHRGTFGLTEVQNLALQHFGIHAEVTPLPGYLDLNYHLQAAKGQAYVLKIAHAGEERATLEMQNALLLHLAQQEKKLLLPRLVKNLGGQALMVITDDQGTARWLRMLTWVPGQLWAKTRPHTTDLREALGRVCGTLDQALSTFDHPAAHRRLDWDLGRAIWIKQYQTYLKTPDQKDTVHYFIERYEKQVLPQLPQLRQSVIHSDLNDYNILVQQRGAEIQVGLFDFGDTVYSHTINEVAIAAAYVGMGQNDPLRAIAELVRGYHSAYPLTEKEISMLYGLIAMRLCVTVCTAAHKRQVEPQNAYLLISEAPAWQLLNQWKAIDPALAHYTFRAVCALEPCPQNEFFQAWLQNQPIPFSDIL